MNLPALTDFIRTFPSAVPQNILSELVTTCQEETGWEPSRIGKGEIDTKVRSCHMKSLVRSNLTLDAKVFKVIQEVASAYAKDHEYLTLNVDEGYTLLRYEEGQHYREHVDMMKDPRVIACSLIINDDYEGGELTFFGGEFTPKTNAGDVLIWPSTFAYPHAILPVTKGTRYSLVTWLS